MRFHIPIRLPSLANTRMHWKALMGLKQKQRRATRRALAGKDLPPPPVVVTITRSGPRRLDGDNLHGSAKFVRDEIAAAVGVDDGSSQYI